MNAMSGPSSHRNGLPEISPGSVSNRKTGRSRAAEDRVIAANVDFYRQIADKYDSYEAYLFDEILQQSLEADLDKIGSYFTSLGRAPSCLECGGGTGNLTLKMCERGWDVTVVDISDHMLDLLKAKALTKGCLPTLVRCPIERFLEATDQSFDLVAFSSWWLSVRYFTTYTLTHPWWNKPPPVCASAACFIRIGIPRFREIDSGRAPLTPSISQLPSSCLT